MSVRERNPCAATVDTEDPFADLAALRADEPVVVMIYEGDHRTDRVDTDERDAFTGVAPPWGQ